MPSSKHLLISGAGAAVLSIRVARSLYSRWRQLPAADRERIGPLAEAAKERALEVRGAQDPRSAAVELRTANETLAAALVESAEANPDVGADEVAQLRGDLRRELERLAEAGSQRPDGAAAIRARARMPARGIKSSRTTGLPAKPQR